jgi:enterochelin esterase family protein
MGAEDSFRAPNHPGHTIMKTIRPARRLAARTVGSSFSASARTAAAAVLLASLSGCIIAPRVTNTLVTGAPEAFRAPSAAIVSPEIDATGRITYRYHAPDAGLVVLVREGAEPLPMTRDELGVWTYTSDPMPPDLYLYSYVVDGVPSHDPANPVAVPTAAARRQSLAHVRGRAPLPWEASGAPAGELKRLEYRSARFGEARELWVYTPPGYNRTRARRYPVLYLLHGVGSDARAWGTAGRVNLILDNLLASGAVEPMLVVMPLGYGFPNARARSREMLSPATDQLAVAREFEASLIEEVLPLVERRYRTRPERGSRAVAGFSMGGSQALHVGLNHPDTFRYVGSMGGALIMYGGRYAEWFAASGPRRPQSVHLSVGADDFLLGVNRHFADWLSAHGTAVCLDEVPGGHTWQVWRRELIRLMPRLFRESGAPSTFQNDQDIR